MRAPCMGRRERRLQARKLIVDEEKAAPKRKMPKGLEAYGKLLPALQVFTLIVLLASIGYVVFFTAQTGDFVRKGVSLAGGTSVTVSTAEPLDTRAIETGLLQRFPGSDVAVRILQSGTQQSGFVVDAANIAPDPTEAEGLLVAALREAYPTEPMSVETTGPTLGAAFFRQTLVAIGIAFVLMALVVFISFRTVYPSLAVVLAGFSTVISTLAVFNLLGMQLSTAGVAAFLMLIGYSIDTDILLSTRILRERGSSFLEQLWSAAKTGLTMQATTAIAVTVVLIFSNNPIFTQIMTIILIGMVFDVLYTWIQNAALLKWYVSRTEGQR